MTDALMTTQDALVARLEDENSQLRREVAEKDRLLASARQSSDSAVRNLRRQLSPLYTALQQVFGEIDTLVGAAPPEDVPSGRVSAVWDAWKGRLSPACGRVIDALQIHGALNTKQICVAAKMGMGTLLGGMGVIAKLNKAGLLDKSNGKYSLRNL